MDDHDEALFVNSLAVGWECVRIDSAYKKPFSSVPTALRGGGGRDWLCNGQRALALVYSRSQREKVILWRRKRKRERRDQ